MQVLMPRAFETLQNWIGWIAAVVVRVDERRMRMVMRLLSLGIGVDRMMGEKVAVDERC